MRAKRAQMRTGSDSNPDTRDAIESSIVLANALSSGAVRSAAANERAYSTILRLVGSITPLPGGALRVVPEAQDPLCILTPE